jgi:hypothetical protein
MGTARGLWLVSKEHVSSTRQGVTMQPSSTPKIELHVHLEGAVEPRELLEIASRNEFVLPAQDEDGLAQLYRFRDFEHFLDLWMMTTPALQKERDFRQVVVAYAEEAASHGAVYKASSPHSNASAEVPPGTRCSPAFVTVPLRARSGSA